MSRFATQVIPAYGRDYSSKKAIIADWNDGKDFIIADFFDPFDGRYINRQDAADAGLRGVRVRYADNRKVTMLMLSAEGKAR